MSIARTIAAAVIIIITGVVVFLGPDQWISYKKLHLTAVIKKGPEDSIEAFVSSDGQTTAASMRCLQSGLPNTSSLPVVVVQRLLNVSHATASSFLSMPLRALRTVSLSPWKRIFSRPRGSTVHILVTGGSMTKGVACDDPPLTAEQCSYSGRLVRRLQELMPEYSFVLTNIARGGSNSKTAIHYVGLAINASAVVYDVIIVDHHVNDLWELVEARDIGVVTQVLLRRIQQMTPQSFIVTLIPGCSQMGRPEMDVKALEVHIAAAEQDAFPLNLRLSAQKHDIAYWQPAPPLRYQVHPSAVTHAVISEAISYAFLVAREIVCSNTLAALGNYSFPRSELYDHCRRPLQVISAYAPPVGWTRGQHTADGGWVFDEDRPGKPGWIALKERSTISFDILLNQPDSFVMISYLRTYTAMGAAQIRISDGAKQRWSDKARHDALRADGHTVDIIEGHWDRNVSVPDTHWVRASEGYLGFGIVGRRATLTFTSLRRGNSNKFKIISITTC